MRSCTARAAASSLPAECVRVDPQGGVRVGVPEAFLGHPHWDAGQGEVAGVEMVEVMETDIPQLRFLEDMREVSAPDIPQV